MSFRLNNIRATYQRMMNKIFREEIGETLEEYMDVMIMKSSVNTFYSYHLNGCSKGSDNIT